jgi:hypothetical protein
MATSGLRRSPCKRSWRLFVNGAAIDGLARLRERGRRRYRRRLVRFQESPDRRTIRFRLGREGCGGLVHDHCGARTVGAAASVERSTVPLASHVSWPLYDCAVQPRSLPQVGGGHGRCASCRPTDRKFRCVDCCDRAALPGSFDYSQPHGLSRCCGVGDDFVFGVIWSLAVNGNHAKARRRRRNSGVRPGAA